MKWTSLSLSVLALVMFVIAFGNFLWAQDVEPTVQAPINATPAVESSVPGDGSQPWAHEGRAGQQNGANMNSQRLFCAPEDRMPATNSISANDQLTSKPAKNTSWWQKMNPFGRGGGETAATTQAPAARRGFTLGTSGANAKRASAVNAGEHSSAQASQNTHRPSWAGGTPRSLHSQQPHQDAGRLTTGSRPNPGHGQNR